jgi:RNA polymerase sigma-70 factor (ECF subfamily)
MDQLGQGSSEKMTVEHGNIPAAATEDAGGESVRLVEAILGGSREAEGEFAARFLRPLRVMLLARTRDRDLTADLLQDTMIQALCALRRGNLREPAKLSAFVMAVARNVLNSHFRSSVRHPESLEFPDDLPSLSTVGDGVEEQERETLAMNAIASLDPLDKQILQMTLVDGLKPGIIAQKLQVNPDVVRQRKLRATRRVIDFVRGQSQTPSGAHIESGRNA